MNLNRGATHSPRPTYKMTTREINASYTSLNTEPKHSNYYEHRHKSGPKDKFFLHVLFFLIGIVCMMPLSFVVTANSYWMHKFRNDTQEKVDLSDKNVYQSYFSSGAIVFQTLPSALFIPIFSAYGHKFTISCRLFTSLLVFAGCLCFCNVSIKTDISNWKTGFFFLVMAEIIITNIVFSLFFVTALVLMSNFPNRFMKPYLFGEGFSGVFTATLQVICLALGNDPDVSAFIYFSSGTFVLLITGILLFLTKYSKVYRYYMEHNAENAKRKDHSRSELIMIVKRIWPCPVIFALAMVLLFGVHPAITALIVPENYGHGNAWSDKYFIPVITFLFTDVCGIGGRYFAKGNITTTNGGWLTLLSILRVVVFIPLLLLCNLMPRQNLPVVFNHDWQYVLIVGSLTFTNGYIHNNCFLSVGKLVPENKELAFLIFLSFIQLSTSMISPVGILMVKLL